jgi:hypothetical protein
MIPRKKPIETDFHSAPETLQGAADFPNPVSQATTLMADIRSPKLLYFKAALFLLLGLLSAGLLLAEHASWKFAALLALAIWSFARAYYFAFYVVQHYIDPEFKFAGLWAFAQYLLRRRTAEKKPGDGP